MAQSTSQGCGTQNAIDSDTTGTFRHAELQLYQAVALNRLDLVQLLIDHLSEDVESWKDFLRKALLLATSRELAELLIQNGADIDRRGEDGSTVLMEANAISLVKLLVEMKVDLEERDKEGRTALRRTVELDDDEAKAKFFIDETKADIEASDNEGRTVLMTAVWKSRRDVLISLLDRKPNVNAPDKRGRVALHHLAFDKMRKYDYKPEAGEHDQQKIDHDILERLVKADSDPSAKDNNGLTCLHWAAAMGSSGLLKVFLLSGSFNVDVDEENYGAWTPLHHACQTDVLSSVKILLDEKADINKKTRNGRTPLHLAAGAGHLAIVQHLLEQPKIKRNARDMFGNTPLLSAASLSSSHPNREAIVKLFSPWQKFHTLSDDATRAAKLWNATIVDFQPRKGEGNGIRATTDKDEEKVSEHKQKVFDSKGRAVGAKQVSQTSMFDLLYERDSKNEDKPAQTVSRSDLGRDGFRWIHLPANNVAWCQDLLIKYYVEEGTMNVNSFKALERSFNQQRGGSEPQSRYMSSTCQPVLRPWGNEEGGIARGDSGEDGLSRSTSSVQLNNKSAIHAERQERQGHESKKTVNWSDKPDTVTSPSASYDDVEPPPMKSQLNSDDAFISDFYVFMPYLHFETFQNQQDMSKLCNHFARIELLPPEEVARAERNNEKDLSLLQAHLESPEHSLHIRRTLDQSFYHHINTEGRDRDQVIHRFQKRFPNKDIPISEHDDSKVLMIDQLWMWVIGQNMIVTSFPPRWGQPKKDPLDLLEYVKSIIDLGKREPIRSVYELAMIITGRCYGAYDRHGVGSEDPHFLDMFEGWIGAAMNDEVEVFKYFKQDSAKASEWLRNPHSLREVKRRQDKLRKKTREETTVRETNFKVIQTTRPKYPSTEESFVENLLDINWETALLEEVKDIRDELGMLSMIFDRQEHVRQSIKDAIDTISGQKGWSPAAVQKFTRAFEDHKKTISQPQKDAERMRSQADGVYESVRDLLDLKQKHANAIEARYAREQTDDTSRQGKTLTVFTTVTTIFLPISFIAAFFAINIDQMPHDKHGQQVLSLGMVSRWTFGVGLSIAILCVALALKVESLYYWFRDMLEKKDSDPHDARAERSSFTNKKMNRPARPPDPFTRQPAGRSTSNNVRNACSAIKMKVLKRRPPAKDEESGTSELQSNGSNGNV